ncbi:hypothetical protein Poli38472_003839 [Pythium oligandrum]|uniref:sn-1-specific diacylglycerol lipase n=1 Tax=Pythium oligandrum TaxID=41045 RepID=A0A8K1FMA1_PYTOL|nr:hypothetical protein Poli38472_003839 [Pythium oligandrum]|eukprot:TMW66074.1 hypothetical protein Poli38472_003839 [Pythium oligandrum]
MTGSLVSNQTRSSSVFGKDTRSLDEEWSMARTDVLSDEDPSPVGVATNRGSKTNQEDTYYIGGRGPERMTLNGFAGRMDGCYGVFDGHGSDRASRYCGENVFPRIQEFWGATHDVKDAIMEGILRIDSEYYEIAKRSERLWISQQASRAQAPQGVACTMHAEDGCTCLVAIIREGILYVGNVGDSRAVLSTKKGQFIPMSVDHKPNRKDERQRLLAKGAHITGAPAIVSSVWGLNKVLDVPRVNGQLAMSRSIGDISLKEWITAEPEIMTHKITDDDRYLIMASDGLWDVLSSKGAAKLASKHPDAQRAANALLKEDDDEMPALVLCGRRSRVGSDDLYCPAFFLILYQLPLVLVSVIYVSLWRHCSSMSLSTQGIPFWFVLGAIPVYGFMACVYLMVMHISAKGTIVDHERRMLMPRLLQVHIVWSVVMFAYGATGLTFWYNFDLCYPDADFVLAIAAAMVTEVSFTWAFGFCILSGAPRHDERDDGVSAHHGTERQTILADRAIPNSDVYVPQDERWVKRCQALCMCVRCVTCNLFGGAGTQHDSMSVVANVLARLFYGSPDLVISDIVAGFILLAAVQAHEEEEELMATMHGCGVSSPEGVETLRELRERLKNNAEYDGQSTITVSDEGVHRTLEPAGLSLPLPLEVDQNDNYVAISIPSPPEGVTKNLLSPTRQDLELIDCVEDLAHYSKFSVGIYGWMLYVWSHPWSGTYRLAFSCMKRNHKYIHGDNFFHLGQTALQLESGVHVEDIVYASFYNSVYRPAFCVTLDHDRREVVIAIRGTLSLEDCLTDAIAYGKPLDDLAGRLGCDGHGEYAHQGFLHAAEAVYLELDRLGVLQMLFDPDSDAPVALDEVNECARGEYREYGLVLTGHSLGAATAVLLSIMLRPKFPNLRCFAFSPPGCTLSPGLARRCNAFVTSVVVGHDIVARASLTSAEDLRDQVIDLIGRSKVGKAAILRQVTAWKKPHELLHDEIPVGELELRQGTGFSAHLANYRTMLQRIQASEPIHPLTMPGRLIHLRRTETYRQVGCWVCCRPGSGGICCTERTNYEFAWSSSDQFKSIKIARTMLDDHFPDKVHHVLQDCVRRMRPKESPCM